MVKAQPVALVRIAPWIGVVGVVSGCFGGGAGFTPVRTPFNKGVYHHTRGEIEAAIAHYRNALDEDKGDFRARFNLAVALEEMAVRSGSGQALSGQGGRTPAEWRAMAEAEYQKILAQHPDHLRASLNLSALEAETGRRTEAAARLSATATRHPGAVAVHVARAAFALGEADMHGAEASLAKARSLDLHHVGAWMLTGDLRRILGDLEGAASAYREALRLAPEDQASLRAFAALQAERGNTSEALVLYETLLRVGGVDEGAHAALADLHEANGAWEDAVFHLWRARDLKADTPDEHYTTRLRALYQRLLDQR